jgi:hypothetical protein
MLARVARWEGADAQTLEASAAEIRKRAETQGGPPPGVPAKGLLLLHDAAGGRAMAISLFDTEEDYREGDETLSSMTPAERRHGTASCRRQIRGCGAARGVR